MALGLRMEKKEEVLGGTRKWQFWCAGAATTSRLRFASSYPPLIQHPPRLSNRFNSALVSLFFIHPQSSTTFTSPLFTFIFLSTRYQTLCHLPLPPTSFVSSLFFFLLANVKYRGAERKKMVKREELDCGELDSHPLTVWLLFAPQTPETFYSQRDPAWQKHMANKTFALYLTARLSGRPEKCSL